MATRSSTASVTLAAVLGSSQMTLPLSYVEREAMEQAFARALSTHTHIVVFGTPGVGKSALIMRNIDMSEVIFVECLKGQRAPDIYRSVLSEAGARIKTETRLTSKKRLSATLKILGGDIERDTENTEAEITIDLGNVGDVFRVLGLRGHRGRFVLLNNFHLLTRAVQRRIVTNLQYVLEHTGTRFIIVGNWTSPAYLADLNSLLPSFVIDVHVELWTDEELRQLLGKVEQLLNVSFADDVAAEVINSSVGSVRELIDNCRRLLAASGIHATQPALVVITDIQQLRDVNQRAMARLNDRFATFLSSYLTTKLYTTETVDVDKFLQQVADDLMADEDDDEDDEKTYSLAELREALADTVTAFNEPRLTERDRRVKLLDELTAAIRRRGNSRISVSVQSVAASYGTNAAAEEYALCSSAKELVQAQAKYGFRPPALAFDPHGRALIAIEPKFRAFLRAESTTSGSLQRDDVRRIDQLHGMRRRWGKRRKWQEAISEAAATRRWLARRAGDGAS
jgi:hypothetical protein